MIVGADQDLNAERVSEQIGVVCLVRLKNGSGCKYCVLIELTNK
jgi:hypothetical protein